VKRCRIDPPPTPYSMRSIAWSRHDPSSASRGWSVGHCSSPK
jgi:hypothetical protein